VVNDRRFERSNRGRRERGSPRGYVGSHPMSPVPDTLKERGSMMLYYALIFLLVGLVAGILGQTGIAAVAGQISWILFVIGIVLLIIHLVRGRVPPGV